MCAWDTSVHLQQGAGEAFLPLFGVLRMSVSAHKNDDPSNIVCLSDVCSCMLACCCVRLTVAVYSCMLSYNSHSPQTRYWSRDRNTVHKPWIVYLDRTSLWTTQSTNQGPQQRAKFKKLIKFSISDLWGGLGFHYRDRRNFTGIPLGIHFWVQEP